MKAIISILSVVLVLFISCNRLPEETRLLIKGEGDAVLVLSVPNASCSKCQNIMETGLNNTKGIKQSILNLHTKEVSIVYDPKEASTDNLEKIVESLRTQFPCK